MLSVDRRGFLRFAGAAVSLLALGIRKAAYAASALMDAVVSRINAAYSHDTVMQYRTSQSNPQVAKLYQDFLGRPMGEKAEQLLHTAYTDRSKNLGVHGPMPRASRGLAGDAVISSVRPNPFSDSTAVSFGIREESHVTLTVYNALGRKVRTVLRADLVVGVHTATWDGLDDGGALLPAGVYSMRLRTAQGCSSGSVRLVR